MQTERHSDTETTESLTETETEDLEGGEPKKREGQRDSARRIPVPA